MKTKKTVAKKKPAKASAEKSKDKMVIALLLDASGSMASCEVPALAGVNEYITTLKNEYKVKPEDGEIYLSFITFSAGYVGGDKIKFVHNLRNITEVENIAQKEYQPAGGTPLLEAIGRTIESLDAVETKNPSATGRNPLVSFLGDSGDGATKFVMVVQTDGQETEWNPAYTKETITKLIKEREDKGNWTFVFLGAGIDAISDGMTMGMGAGRAHAFSGAKSGRGSYEAVYAAAAESTSVLRGSSVTSSKRFASEMEEILDKKETIIGTAKPKK